PQERSGMHGAGRGPRGGGFRGPGAAMGLRGIDLTDAQRDQVRTITASHTTEFEQARTKLRDAHRALAEAAAAESIDEAAIRAKSGDVAAAMADEAILRARVRAEVFGILTAEQLQKAKERRTAMQERMKERRLRRNE
ncbi:MAG: Spy/CpxP family protein refolding chaperone, partial [Vicinamibacterales bacterium]